MGVKIKEIASAAGVSVATVSLVLNNKPGISETTRQKVLSIANSLYEKSDNNNFLKVSKGSIRFLKIIKHGHVLNRDHDVFISSYIDGLELETRKNGYKLEINTFNSPDYHVMIDQIEGSSIDGLIVLGTELNEKDLGVFESVSIPIVIIDTCFDFQKFDFVDMDNASAVFQIINHFAESGHREIGHITSHTDCRNFELRRISFKNAIKYFKLRYNEKYIYSVDSTFNGAYNDMLRIIKKGVKLPTALFSANDIMAYGCIKAFKETGLKIPDDISIIGFDDLPMSALMDPPLTTMRVSKRQIGKIAAQLIINRINKTFSAPTIKTTVGGKMILRKSVKNILNPDQ